MNEQDMDALVQRLQFAHLDRRGVQQDMRDAAAMLTRLAAQQLADAADAARYRWLRAAKGLTLRSEPYSVWTRQDGSTFVSTHYLAAFDTQYAPEPSLDAAIDAALARAKEG